MTEEENQKMASYLQMNLADYKSEIIQALQKSTSANTNYNYSLTDDVLTIKKITCTNGIAYRIAKIFLTEVPLQNSIPQLMGAVTNHLNLVISDNAVKEKQIKQLTKGTDVFKSSLQCNN